jgi:hypothetical protein
MKKSCLLIIISSIYFSCKKTEPAPTPLIKDEKIAFTVLIDTTKTVKITSDNLPITINLNSKIPAKGITYSVQVLDSTNVQVFSKDSISTTNSVTIISKNFQIYQKYKTKITVTSISNPSNSLSKQYNVQRDRVYKNYLKTSYELSNPDSWLSSNDLYYNGQKYILLNPLLDQQFSQLDINGDGLEDLFYYDGYSLNGPTPNPPPSVFMNNGMRLNKTEWSGPKILNPHGSKLLVGDFNNDSLPDIFTVVGFDLPNSSIGVPLVQSSHLLFNSVNGFTKVKEFQDLEGYWHAGCSGDIDKDGDLDIIVFNFHYLGNGVKSRILWNDGKGNFTYDSTGIGEIPIVVHAELYDVNSDGWLDLVINYIKPNYTPCPCPHVNEFKIMWGNGTGFSLNNSSSLNIIDSKDLMDIDFVDVNNDGISEIILSGTDQSVGLKYFIDLYTSEDKGITFNNKTNQYFDVTNFPRFGHMTIKDIDNNGKIDIYSADKKDNIRWEWNGVKFIKK